jgi:hypothetical protein
MLKKRDAQGLSIQIIILVAIGLIVLIVLIAIFSRETGRTVGALESCESKGGSCAESCDNGKVLPYIDCGESKVCCVKV